MDSHLVQSPQGQAPTGPGRPCAPTRHSLPSPLSVCLRDQLASHVFLEAGWPFPAGAGGPLSARGGPCRVVGAVPNLVPGPRVQAPLSDRGAPALLALLFPRGAVELLVGTARMSWHGGLRAVRGERVLGQLGPGRAGRPPDFLLLRKLQEGRAPAGLPLWETLARLG